jgi:aminopeptidase N
MRNEQVLTVLRADYRAPAFVTERAELEFDLDPALTTVTSRLHLRRVQDGATELWLDGEDLEFLGVWLDGTPLADARLEVRANGLCIRGLPERCVLTVRNRVRPEANTQLSGLYTSNGNFLTQCEAEGFRRITYFQDRPDVMARYDVTLRADAARSPVLLANGNLIEQGSLPDGRHWARWEDPFPKPSYLFALVAGRYALTEERMRLASGREALLQVWVDPGQEGRTAYAMASLKRAIRWDEERYGLELDLDRFMIVASNDFNMGAMENKGLNIFNARYVLADPSVATDTDYANIESIVAHEYFHNWTGNRVTCRDWFQLSLKEGLTVFRDQEFSADQMGSDSGRAVRRIEDVRTLRTAQFPEDAGPMAHPVRPDSYQQVDNFYTATVYEKGAEVVRMYDTLLGRAGFRRGMDLYFQRHDGQAVTCDDFRAAMADANRRDLGQFERWYDQAGTPRVEARGRHDPVAASFELTLTQTTPPTPGQPSKLPLHIPVALGLVGADGRDLPLRLAGEAEAGPTTRVLELTAREQRYLFVDLPDQPVLSLGRGYSAPVVFDAHHDEAALAFLAAHDSDPFNRWEAGQTLALARLQRLADSVEAGRTLALDEAYVAAVRATLLDERLSPAFRELALALPGEGFVAEQRAVVDPGAIRVAREFVRAELGRRLEPELLAAHAAHRTRGPYSPGPEQAGPRALSNGALALLVAAGSEQALDLARAQFDTADNLTDRLAALTALVNSAAPDKADWLVRTAREWAREPLLMNKWYEIQARAVRQAGEPPVLERVRRLMRHPGYSLANPNNVYALIRSFCWANPAEFHLTDGSGYAFWVEQVLALDALNPKVASQLARSLERWPKFTPERAAAMRAALAEVAARQGLSSDVREVVGKALENA